MNDLVRVCGLWENTSRSGNRYLAGSLGAARLMLFKNRDKRQEKEPDWVLFLAPGKEQNDRAGRQQRAPAERSSPQDGFDPEESRW